MEFGLLGERTGYACARLAHSMFGGYEYSMKAISPSELRDYVLEGDFKGINITEPYKEAVLPMCDELSPMAKKLRSVNVIIKDKNGRISGYNTDYNALLYAISRAGLRFNGKKVLIYGDSGYAKAACEAAEYHSARQIVRLSKWGSNSLDRLKDHTDAHIIINASYVGMYPNNGQNIINLDMFPQCEGVVETIHNPIRSALLLSASDKGVPYSDPVAMLAAKAKYTSELFVDRMVADERIQPVVCRMRREMSNIVLVGMPGCGKTMLGKSLAQKMDRGFLDIDTIIEQRSGVPVGKIIEKEGEASFRNMEAKIISNIGKQTGKVIAVGSGAVLAECNYPNLKQNGVIIFLDRSIARLMPGGKPSAGSIAKLERVYSQRLPRYLHFADCTVDNNGTIQQTAEKVLKEFLREADEY